MKNRYRSSHTESFFTFSLSAVGKVPGDAELFLFLLMESDHF
jgi:hypothetical protein